VNVAAVLAEARHRSGLTTRQLARRARTSHSAIAAYESGAKAPNTATLERLVHACGFAIEHRLCALAEFENRAERGRQLLEVLDLADQFPSEHGSRLATCFARP
jgi:transcriptional regulator with XRE-family HTH domain